MKFELLNRALVASLAAVALVSCGGGTGDDEAGSPTVLSVQPATLTGLGADVNSCGSGDRGYVYVYGGVAPYRIDNTAPGYVTIDRTTVDDRGGRFKVTLTGACITNGTIVVVDKLDKQVVFTVSSVKGTDPAASSPAN